MKHSNQVVQVIDEAVKREPSGRFLFWTLTSKNTYDGQELKKALSEMTKAFNKLKQSLNPCQFLFCPFCLAYRKPDSARIKFLLSFGFLV